MRQILSHLLAKVNLQWVKRQGNRNVEYFHRFTHLHTVNTPKSISQVMDNPLLPAKEKGEVVLLTHEKNITYISLTLRLP
jgi:hypothetical protein